MCLRDVVPWVRVYKNEGEVGAGIEEAIRQGLVRRRDLFITGKLWNTFHRPEDVERWASLS